MKTKESAGFVRLGHIAQKAQLQGRETAALLGTQGLASAAAALFSSDAAALFSHETTAGARSRKPLTLLTGSRGFELADNTAPTL